MGIFKERMERELEIRGLSKNTKKVYLKCMKDLIKYFMNPPDQITLEEFMWRFLLHILPKGFVRIRFYGFLCNRKKKENIKHIRELLGEKESGQEYLYYNIRMDSS